MITGLGGDKIVVVTGVGLVVLNRTGPVGRIVPSGTTARRTGPVIHGIFI